MIERSEIEEFGKRTLTGILSDHYEGRLYLCGGAFKSVLNPEIPMNDVDVWVDDKDERAVLLQEIVGGGGTLVRDYTPYCIKLEKAGLPIEITYQSVRQRPLSWIVQGFDLGICSIGTTFEGGEILESYIADAAERSVAEGIIYLNDGHLDSLQERHLPTLLRSLDRMESAASDLGYLPSVKDTVGLWRLYESYSPEERRECIHVYLETMVDYKGRCNTELTKMAIRRIKAMRKSYETETRRNVPSRELEKALA